MGFQKLKTKVIAYGDYKNFDEAKFRSDIVTATSNVGNFGMNKMTIFNMFNHHVPIQMKSICANEAPFMSKELHKAIMKRSRLGNRFLNIEPILTKKLQHQRNLCKRTFEKH